MAGADALKEGVLIIIRGDTLALGVLRLRRPEGLTVGHQYGREGLAVLLAAFAEEARRARIGSGGAHHRVQGRQLAQMLQRMYALAHSRLHIGPAVEGSTVVTQIF